MRKSIPTLFLILLLSSVMVSAQTKVSAECNQVSDCPIPTKNSCPGFLAGCFNNQCTYDNSVPNAVVCGNEMVTILLLYNKLSQRTEVPPESDTTFHFSMNYRKTAFNIGDNVFTATSPSFLCTTSETYVYAPAPSSSCWESDVNYGGKTYNLKDSQSVMIEPSISIQYFAGGKLTYGVFKRPEEWANLFVFKVDKDALGLSIEEGAYILKGSQKNIKTSLINNLPSGNVLIKVNQKPKQTNQILPEQRIEQHIIQGDNEVMFPIDTSNYGINQITIQMFYKITADGEVYIPSSLFTLNYNVVDEIPNVNNPPIVVTNPPSNGGGDVPPAQTSTKGILIIVSILFGLLLLRRWFK